MERQTVIDNIENVVASIGNINSFVKVINAFTHQPRSKKEVRDFCEQYVLDVFLSPGELKVVYAQMTVEPTQSNCIDLIHRIVTHPTTQSDALLKTFKRNLDRTIDSVLVLISTSVDAMNRENTPEVGAKIIQVNQALCLMRHIFSTVRDVPITEETFPAFQQTYDGDEYLLCQFDEIVKETQKHFKTLSDSVCTYDLISRWGQLKPVNYYLCLNNWLSLKAFILYLDTL